MKYLTYLYIGLIFTITLFLAGLTFPLETPEIDQWKALFILIVLSMAVQVVSSAMPGRQLRIPHMIFFFTGVLLLPPMLFSILIVSIVLVDWEYNRREGNPIVRDKYLLPVRIGTHLLAAFGAYWILEFTLSAPIWVLGLGQVVAIVLAAVGYAALHQVSGRSVSLVQGMDLHESGVTDLDSFLIKISMLLMGYGVAILWLANPWLLLIGLIPGLYYYRVHVIPDLRAEACTDAKTGLSNMRHFDELFNAELARASRVNQPLSMIMVDVDDLGIINNSYGHLVGDNALLTVSGTIRDAISPNDIAARLGGEEFAIVLPETDLATAVNFAEQLRGQIEHKEFSAIQDDGLLQTTVSVGVATFPTHGLTTLELIHSADVAMYQAKQWGKNRVVSTEDVDERHGAGQESTEVIYYRAAYSSSEAAGAQTDELGEVASSAEAVLNHLYNQPNSATDATIGVAAKSQLPTNAQVVRAMAIENLAEVAATDGTRRSYPVRSTIPTEMEPEMEPEMDSAIDSGRSIHHRLPEHNAEPASFVESDETAGHVEPQERITPQPDELSQFVHNSGKGSAVEKYQSSIKNGPTTTEIISALRLSPLDEVRKEGLANLPMMPVIFTVGFGVAAIALTLYLTDTPLNFLALFVFGLVALIVQLLQYSMYESSTISVSAAIILAATLVEGLPGLLTTCSLVVLAHSIQYRPAFHKIAFNWSSHIIAGLAPLIVYQLGITRGAGNLPLLVLLTLSSAVAYYAIESAFIASAIGLANGQNIIKIWNNQFRWLAIHYVVAGFVALSIALAYIALGPWGVVAFAMPVLLIYFAQKQYVIRTEQSTKELNWMNGKLRKANTDITTANRAFHRLTDELFMILSKIIDARDPDVHGHASQVSTYAEAIAHELGLKQNEIEQLRRGALLHDLGKLGIPESILHKPGPLSDQEYEIMKRHPELGADLLNTCRGLRELAPYVLHHHEWWNGMGYPSALYQEQIPLGARIIAVCDAVEAMASDRPYRKGLSESEIISELVKGKGQQFDPVVVDTFTKIVKQEGPGLLKNTAGQATAYSI